LDALKSRADGASESSGQRCLAHPRHVLDEEVPAGDEADHGEYSDIDMRFLAGRYTGGGGFTRKDGSSF